MHAITRAVLKNEGIVVSSTKGKFDRVNSLTILFKGGDARNAFHSELSGKLKSEIPGLVLQKTKVDDILGRPKRKAIVISHSSEDLAPIHRLLSSIDVLSAIRDNFPRAKRRLTFKGNRLLELCSKSQQNFELGAGNAFYVWRKTNHESNYAKQANQNTLATKPLTCGDKARYSRSSKFCRLCA